MKGKRGETMEQQREENRQHRKVIQPVVHRIERR
nr:MAG TPA: hypothetical protein [Caudoviricetes sp.]